MSSSKSKSLLWSHFTPVNEEKKVTCLYCDQQLSVANKSTCSLIRHITKKHPSQNILKKKNSLAYNKLTEMKQAQNQDESIDDKEEVIYFVADDSKSPDPMKTKRPLYHDGVGTRERKLIEQFTEEKIALTNIQKEVMEKELEEKTIKVLLLQEEMEHRKHMYELEKQEMERKKQIQEMTKEEMFLKIALLKINLSKESTECAEPDMHTIEIVSTE